MKSSLSLPLCLLYLLANPIPDPVQAETLMSLYQTALQHFPSLEAYRYKEKSLESEKTGLAWQKFLNLDASTNYYHFSTVDLGRYNSGDVSLSNTFDIFNKKGLDRTIIRYEIEKNRSLTDMEKKNIFSTVTENYFNVLRNYRLLKIHGENLDWLEKNITLVNTGVENGIFAATDLNRWTIEKLICRNSIQSDKLELARSEESLRTLTGLDSIVPDDSEQPGPEALSEEDILKHSPELMVFELEKKQLEQEIRKENRNQLPDLQVGNSLVRNHEPGSTGDQYLVTASLGFKLFDGGRRYRVQSHQARIESLGSDQRAARAALTEYYRNKLREMATQREMLGNLETARDLSADNLKKLAAGYQKRFIDFTALFNAFREDVSLRENCENTSFDFNKNYQILYHLASGDIYF